MSINKKIISLLKKKKIKLSIAESCTGGMLSNAITSVSGSSKVFNVGLVTYSNESKISILKVSKPKDLATCKNFGRVRPLLSSAPTNFLKFFLCINFIVK